MRRRTFYKLNVAPNGRLITSHRLMEVFAMVSGGLFLFWCVLTKSLPYVLATSNPEYALWLNADNPPALRNVAERARQDLLELTAPDIQTTTLSDNSEIALVTGQERSLELSESEHELGNRSESIRILREKIERFAFRAAINDPRNAQALSLLAEVSDSSDETRRLMIEAFKRSRRVPVAILWLMADSFQKRDFIDVVEKADALFRTQPQFSPEAMEYLGRLAAIPEGRSALIFMLAKQPIWRGKFWDALPKNVRYAGTPYDLLIGLKNNGDRLASAEIAPYLNLLVKAGLTPYAYWAWSTLLEEQGDTRTQFLVNSDFREDLTEIPFDWAIQKGQNATYQFAPKQSGDGRSVRFEFGVGRVKFPTLSQLVVLDPGLYRFSGQIRGKVHAQRGLRWTVSCWQGKKIAQTEMLFGGKGHTWQDFQLSFEVSKMDCNAIQLKLIHDSRSTSEMFVSGYVSFRRLNLMSFSPTFN